MAYLEERLNAYLTADPHLFISEQRFLAYGTGDRDHWWIDALVVDPWQKVMFLAEATYDIRPASLAKKANLFAQRKAEAVQRVVGEGLPAGWDMRVWAFIRSDATRYFLSRLEDGVAPRITHIEKAAFPWEYEPARKMGKEPGRPYPHLDAKFQQ